MLTGVYGLIVFMHHSRWRDRLPGNRLLSLCVSKFFCLVFHDHNLVVAFCSKTSILQLCMCDVAIEWPITVWMFPSCKWSRIWFMVHTEHFSNFMVTYSPSGAILDDDLFRCRLYNLTTVCYHSLYLPLLYVTFLADFFQVPSCL